VNISLFGDYALAIVISIFGVLVARTMVVYGIGGALALRNITLSRNWQHIINWAGFHGVISVMLPITHGTEIAVVTFGVVFFSILVQGASIRFLVKKFSSTKSKPN
jgi:CPA1 family monovalent cation:H+ antiporter